MDSRKLQFLQAVVGEDGARALSKAVERAEELDQAIFPRTILAWLEVVAPFGYDGNVPGVTVPFAFAKTQKGFAGSIAVNGEMHRFEDATLAHVAGCVAVALGLDHERVSPLAKNEQLAKLGKSIDLLIKSQLVKTSWNVKQRRKYQFAPGASEPTRSGPWNDPLKLSPEQVEARRVRYAQSIGLDPYREQMSRGQDFPVSQGGTELPYEDDFGVEHETAHAMMVPPGKVLGDYQTELSGTAKSPITTSRLADIDDEQEQAEFRQHMMGTPEYQAHALGTQQENIANHLEHHIDRRAGLDATAFQSQYRKPSLPKVGTHKEFPIWETTPNGRNIPAKPIRDEAQRYAQRFDEGAHFVGNGEVKPASGVHGKINARAKAKLPMVKATLKPNTAKLPGTTAKPIQPVAPIAPTPTQPKNQKQAPQGAAGTSQTTQLPQLPKVSSKKKSIQVTKSESQKKCPHCMRPQFNGDAFKGCFCWAGLAKSVKVSSTDEGFTLTFGSVWDEDAIATLVETFRGK